MTLDKFTLSFWASVSSPNKKRCFKVSPKYPFLLQYIKCKKAKIVLAVLKCTRLMEKEMHGVSTLTNFDYLIFCTNVIYKHAHIPK